MDFPIETIHLIYLWILINFDMYIESSKYKLNEEYK